jgi:hypothetical protein
MRSDDRPAWLVRAYELEAGDQLEAAEQEISRAVQHIGAAATIADMYADRMRRLRAQGDDKRAAAARTLAVQWIHFYASQATSGGEGMALSLERDRFLAGL